MRRAQLLRAFLTDAFAKAYGFLVTRGPRRTAVRWDHAPGRGYVLRVSPSLLREGVPEVVAYQKGWRFRPAVDLDVSGGRDLAFGVPYGTTHVVVRPRGSEREPYFFRLSTRVDPVGDAHEHRIERVGAQEWYREVGVL